jgi:type I restriction-modification system DNA methylase subunit
LCSSVGLSELPLPGNPTAHSVVWGRRRIRHQECLPAAARDALLNNTNQYDFFVPDEACWARVRHAKQSVGSVLNKALAAIEDANPDTLQDVLKGINFNRRVGQRTLDDTTLVEFIQHFDGIPACILVLNRAGAHERDAVLIINADREYREGKNQNSLQPEDVEKISTVYGDRLEVPGYSRLVPYAELAAEDYNLNIHRT